MILMAAIQESIKLQACWQQEDAENPNKGSMTCQRDSQRQFQYYRTDTVNGQMVQPTTWLT